MGNVCGIDGCRAGWVVASIGKGLSLCVITRLAELEKLAPLDLVLIDIPIGFPDRQYRSCELEARAILGKRRNSVFFTPVKEAVLSRTYEEACRENFKLLGKKISLQSFHIREKIVETYHLVRTSKQTIRESHPELCFQLYQGSSLLHGKKTKKGQLERRNVIRRHDDRFIAIIDDFISSTKRKDVAVDDILDAVILAITAQARGQVKTIPNWQDLDPEGLPREIVIPSC